LALTHTPPVKFGEKAPDFDLPGVDGRNWSLLECMGSAGILVMFICNHCPYVKAINHKIVRDTTELLDLGINSVAIMSNDVREYPEDSIENMRCVSEQQGYPFPYLVDESQDVAKAYGAVCTPDFFGFNSKLELQYRGRLDESGARNDAGDVRRDLFLAMELIATSGVGPVEQVSSIGCSIKWRASGGRATDSHAV
jgi:peroxiredoxin